MNKKTLLFLLFLIFIFNIGFSSSQFVGKYNGEINVGLSLNFSNFDLSNLDTYPLEILNQIFEPLFEVDPINFKIKPLLAKSWRIYREGKEWIFYLRKDVKWADGENFTADDVVFSFKDIKDFHLEKIDDYSIRMISEKPLYPIFNPLPLIIPKHIFEKTLNKTEIIGTGPFMLKEYIPNKEVVLIRNPNYWRRDNEGNSLPYLDRIVFKVNYSLNDNLDIIKMPSNKFNEIENLRKEYKVYNLGPNLESDVLLINQNPNAPIPKYKLSWFQNVKFRRALAYAINENLIIEKIYYGYAHPRNSPFHPLSPYYTENTFKYSYNLEIAKKLLEDIGFRDRNNDGFLEDLKGNLLSLELVVEDDNQIKGIAEIIREDFNKLGIKLNIVFKNSIPLKLFQTFNWELVLIKHKWNIDPSKDKEIFLSKGSYHFWNPFQRKPFYPWEKNIDSLFNKFLEEKSILKRKILCYEIQRIWNKNLPLITITSPSLIYLAKKNIRNFKPSLFLGPLWNSYEIF
ncbi:MAG: ABC transporter substrate-binding protein [Dictyoglomaceae bacterium]